MDAMDSGDESDHDLIYAEMLENIRDRSQSRPNVNRIEARYKMRDIIKQRQLERKGALKVMQNMGKGLHKVFKTVVKEISQELTPLGESGSQVSHFIPETRNFAEVTNLSDDKNKPWLKANMKEINNLINSQNFIVEDPDNDEPVTP